MGVEIVRVRGDNSHHVIESCFKAFSRCLRKVMDGERDSGALDRGVYHGGKEVEPKGRVCGVERTTKETSISITLDFQFIW